jgi:hypothetical protein
MNTMARTEMTTKNGLRTLSGSSWSRPHAPPRFRAKVK